MSQYRIEKQHNVTASITLATGAEVRGRFFLADTATAHSGRERVYDLLNDPDRFFPFDVEGRDGKPSHVSLIARAHVLFATLDEPSTELPSDDLSIGMAARKFVSLLLSNGVRLRGELLVVMPEGKDRVSDFANCEGRFQYFANRDQMAIVNFDHVVEILPMAE
jgi:hypothetical protein